MYTMHTIYQLIQHILYIYTIYIQCKPRVTGGDSPTWPPWVEGVVIMSHLALGEQMHSEDDHDGVLNIQSSGMMQRYEMNK